MVAKQSPLVLRELTAGDEATFLEAYQAFQDPNFVFALEYDPQSCFAEYLAKLDKIKRGVDLPVDRVPASLYFGFVDGVIVGRISFRHTLNDTLFKHGGHLGYGVVPQYRGKGYATEMLRLAIPMVKERCVFRVLLTPINDVSRKVIEACGGQLETPSLGPDLSGPGPRYWIQIGDRDGKPAWPEGAAAKADLIIIHGAPGIGKTTVGRLLKKILKGAFLDLDWVRSNHLDETWRNKSPDEEKMSYRILIRTINEYLSHGYKNIVLNSADLKQLLGHEDLFRSIDYRVITLTADDSELRKRVLDPLRDSGWRDVEGSIVRNQRIVGRPLWRNEIRIDTTLQSPEVTAQTISALITGTVDVG